MSAIVCSIGGEDSVRVLPFLDGTLAANRPKILMGYSDTTTQLLFEARGEYRYPSFGRYHVGFHDWADPAGLRHRDAHPARVTHQVSPGATRTPS